MAKEITKWEAETDTPTIHDTIEEAVTAELAEMMGWKGGPDSQAPGIARIMAEKPFEYIDCLQQLTRGDNL